MAYENIIAEWIDRTEEKVIVPDNTPIVAEQFPDTREYWRKVYAENSMRNPFEIETSKGYDYTPHIARVRKVVNYKTDVMRNMQNMAQTRKAVGFWERIDSYILEK